MGNTKSCESIQPRIDRACDIGKCTKSIRGYASNSASPTDIWELEMYDDVRYGQEKIPNKLILKLYIDISSEILKFGNLESKDREELRYESDIYNYVIGLFTRENINPYFVRYYGASQNCTFDQLVESVTAGKSIVLGEMTKLEISKEQFIENLIRNTAYMVFNLRGRPSISTISASSDNTIGGISKKEIVDVLKDSILKNDEVKYGMIITEKSNGEVFDNWINRQIVNGKISDDGWKSIVQVVSALTALETLEVAHNDLHYGNIFVEELDGEVLEQFKYTYNDKELGFGIRSNFRCAIYDWDRGYMKKLGDNYYLDDNELCKWYSQCNEYVAQREVTKFLIYMLQDNKLDFDEREKIYECMMVGDTDKVDYFEDRVVANSDTGRFLYFDSFTRDRTMTRKDFEELGIFTPSKVLTKLLFLLKRQGIIEFISSNESDYFDENSVIYDMRRDIVQEKFSNYYHKKDFKHMEIFEDDTLRNYFSEDKKFDDVFSYE